MMATDLRRQFLHRPLDEIVHALLAARNLLQPEGAERRGHAPADLAAGNLGKLHRVAADVADESLCLGPAEQHALRRQPRLFLAVDDPELEAGLAFDQRLELRPVLGFAHRGGRDAGQRGQGHALGKRGETLQRRERPLAPPGVEPSGVDQSLAETGHHLFVVVIGRAAGGAVEDHETDRVRSDIDHADAFDRPRGRVVKQRTPERPPIFHRQTSFLVHRGSRLDGIACVSGLQVNPSCGQASARPSPPPIRGPKATGSP